MYNTLDRLFQLDYAHEQETPSVLLVTVEKLYRLVLFSLTIVGTQECVVNRALRLLVVHSACSYTSVITAQFLAVKVQQDAELNSHTSFFKSCIASFSMVSKKLWYTQIFVYEIHAFYFMRNIKKWKYTKLQNFCEIWIRGSFMKGCDIYGSI